MAHNGLEAEKILEEQRPEIVIMEAWMPGKERIDLQKLQCSWQNEYRLDIIITFRNIV